MGLQYQPEELLRLRDSPLVSKPASLPPIEEWMGPPQEQASKRANGARGKQEGSFGNESNSRPSILETRHISRTSGNVPSDIVLGPPKTAFASASSLRSPRQFDSPSRSAFGNFGGDGSRGDYFGPRSINNGEREGKDDRSRDTPGAKSRFDLDNWAGPRSARYSDREGNEDMRKAPFRSQNLVKREGDENRRNGAGRGSKPSWFRDDESTATPRESKMENIRNREWHEGDKGQRRGGERDWPRSARTEQDPEWMAEEKPKEKKERHTAEDIEQWKAAMRAQSKGIKDDSDSVQDSHHLRSASGSTSLKAKLETPLTAPENGADTFFSIWDRPKADHMQSEGVSEDGTRAQHAKQAAPKSSRFTGFFGPQPAATLKEPEMPSSSAQNTENNFPMAEKSVLDTYNAVFDEHPNEDKAGFERMLQMLRNPQSTAPEAEARREVITPDQARLAEDRQDGAAQPPNPRHSPKVLSPKSQRAHGFETLLGPQSPREGPAVYNKDTEFLLNLLRKDDTWKQSFPGLGQGGKNNAPGILPHPNVMAQIQNPHALQENGPNAFAEDTKADHARHHDKLNPTTSGPPHRHHGPFDEPSEPHHFPPLFPMGNPNIHPGLQGPPGFDHPPPPGFSSFMSPQPQNQRGGPMAPPPGFPTPTRNPNPGHFPPGLAPRMANMNLGGPDRGPPMGMGPGGGPPGPGPGPFMGGPPLFPPHSVGFPMMGGASGGGGPLGNGPGGRPLDMFGGGGDFGANGGGRGAGPGGPHLGGGFARQD